MTATAWDLHDKARLYLSSKVIGLDTDSFKMILCLVGSNLPTVATNGYASVTNEHAGANGYTQGGAAVASPTWVESGGTVTFDCSDQIWTASGGSIVARTAGIYVDTVTTPVADPVLCHTLLDDVPADVTAADTKDFKVTIHASGVFTTP